MDGGIVDVNTGVEVISFRTFGDESFNGTLPAGSYFVDLFAYSDLTDYTFDVTFTIPPATEIEPNEDDATATPFSTQSRGANGTLTDSTDVDVFSFSPVADMAAGEVFVLRMTPDSAAGATPTFTCEVRGPAGPIATATTVSNECVMFLTGLLAADTYTFDIRTDSADAVDYDVTFETINGQVEDPAANNVINIGSLGGAGAPADVFIGELVTDGVNPSVDAITFRIDSIDAGQLLIANIVPVYNRATAPAIEAEIVDATSTQVAQVTGAPYQFALDTITTGIYTLNLTRPDTDAAQTFRYRVSFEIATRVIASDAPGTPINSTLPPTVSTINVGETCTITDIVIPMDISHTWKGDMDISLESPAGTVVVLHDRTGGSDNDIIGTYGDDLTAAGDLTDFVGESTTGTWTLTVTDNVGGDNGTLNSWGIEADCQ
jgi:subtilisin-like proprotein convertase family protein